jgi:hypothetical protein
VKKEKEVRKITKEGKRVRSISIILFYDTKRKERKEKQKKRQRDFCFVVDDVLPPKSLFVCCCFLAPHLTF